MSTKILITGCAGFIGAAVSQTLLQQGYQVIGIDNLNHYYDVKLKLARLELLQAQSNFIFYQNDLADSDAIKTIFTKHRPARVINLAAQAGVRYSIEHPETYINSNLVGFANILEACRHHNVEHLVFASSSSVYGANEKYPYSETDNVDHPVSLYAATKKANEVMAHSYSHLYALPVTGLRYFTVYGPWGRPDMAPFKFIDAISRGKPISVYNHGHHKRDFTFIDDIVAGTIKVMETLPTPADNWDANAPVPCESLAPYKIYNIGCGQPVALLRFIEIIEDTLGKKAVKDLQPKQPGDVEQTFADVSALARDIGYRPRVLLEQGIVQLVSWYKEFYGMG